MYERIQQHLQHVYIVASFFAWYCVEICVARNKQRNSSTKSTKDNHQEDEQEKGLISNQTCTAWWSAYINTSVSTSSRMEGTLCIWILAGHQ